MSPFVLGLLFVAGIFAVAVKTSKKTNEQWRAAARELGLELKLSGLFANRRMTGERGGFPVRIETFTRRSGKSSATYTRYVVAFDPLGVDLHVERDTSIAIFKKLLAQKDFTIGDEELDRELLIRGTSPAAVAACLTPERRRALREAFAKLNGLTVEDARMRLEHRGTAKRARLRATIDEMIRTAEAFSNEREPTPRVTAERRERLEPDEEPRKPFAFGAAPIDSPAAFAEGDPSELETPPPLAASLEPIEVDPVEVDPVEVEPIATASPEPEPEPEPADNPTLDADASEAAAALFVPGRMGTEIRKAFDDDYAGRTVRWNGELARVEPYSVDATFPGGAGTRAHVVLHAIEGTAIGAGEVRAVVQLPPNAEAELAPHLGERVALSGRLVRCDPYMRTLFVASGAVEPA